MSASIKAAHDAAAAAYERHINDNWDRLAPFEQEQARAYLAAKEQAAQQPKSSNYQQPGFVDPDSLYGGMYGNLGLPSRREEEGSWAVPVGYIGVLLVPLLGIAFGVLFLPLLGIGFGIYNFTNGRAGHGSAQILLGIGFLFLSISGMTPSY